ncbi:hypothetical protein MASR2M39_16090 [Ignavibacteriales bacterium]
MAVKKQILLLFIILSFPVFSQTVSVSGKVVDQKTGEPLSFGTLRVVGNKTGTTSNKDGNYELLLKKGNYKIAASFVGYLSDTIEVDVNKSLTNVNFSLVSSQVELKEITVFPGENPAFGIIRKAIERKNFRKEILKTYKFNAYTKGIIRTTEDISVSGSRAGQAITLGTASDTGDLKITGIIENVSEAFFKAPSQYKEIITARRQSANVPPFANILTGGRFIANFYEDQINFFGNNNFIGPIADNSTTHYYYYIKDTLSIDHKNIFKIHIEPDDPADPGFIGDLYILDKSFDLIKVELSANKVGTVANFFDSLTFFQQYLEYTENAIYMPADYRISADVNYLGLLKAGFELNTALNDWEINIPLSDDIFGKALITVLPDADSKDSSFWNVYQGIPNTIEEVEAYTRIDSLENQPQSFWENFSLLSDRISFNDNFSISGLPASYHFNPVEGHTVDFRVNGFDLFNKRFNSVLNLNYGFGDEKFKSSLSATYLLGDYRTHRIDFKVYDGINTLFRSNQEYGKVFTSLSTLFSKYDFNDYYYSKGIEFSYSGEIFPVLNVDLGFKNRTDNSAVINSNASLFNSDKKYRQNLPVTEVRLNEFSAGLRFDSRNYIEDGLYRRRLWGNFHFTTEAEIKFVPGELSSGIDYKSYSLWGRMFLRTSLNTTMTIRANIFSTDGGIPVQMLFSLPGNIAGTSQNQSFRTLDLGEFIGDRGWTVFIVENLGDLPLQLTGISFLKRLNLQFTGFFNAGMIEYGQASQSLQPFNVKRLTSPLYEIGFGVGHQLFPVRFDFGFRLNHTEEKSFRIGINTFLIL